MATTLVPAALAAREKAMPLAPPHRLHLIGIGVVGGVAVAALSAALVMGRGQAQQVVAAPRDAMPVLAEPASMDALLIRLTQLEAALAATADMARRAVETAQGAESAHGRVDARMREIERLVAERGPQGDRFVAAALLLQASVITPRPWLREYQAMIDLAPAGYLSRTAAEVLASHAARGVPSEAELRERFVALAPQLQARAPHQGSALEVTVTSLRGIVASTGLMAPPPPTDQEQAIAGVERQLRRGNLAGAVADAAALDASLQPLLSGWLAQARARLAVEQVVQETLLRILAPRAIAAPANPS
jgi:hypothetical protein